MFIVVYVICKSSIVVGIQIAFQENIVLPMVYVMHTEAIVVGIQIAGQENIVLRMVIVIRRMTHIQHVIMKVIVLMDNTVLLMVIATQLIKAI